MPVLDVVAPSAAQAAQQSAKELVAVLGTEATIASGAYEQAIRKHNPRIRVVQQSCPLFVPIVEEGRTGHDPLTRLAIQDYLSPVKKLAPETAGGGAADDLAGIGGDDQAHRANGEVGLAEARLADPLYGAAAVVG